MIPVLGGNKEIGGEEGLIRETGRKQDGGNPKTGQKVAGGVEIEVVVVREREVG